MPYGKPNGKGRMTQAARSERRAKAKTYLKTDLIKNIFEAMLAGLTRTEIAETLNLDIEDVDREVREAMQAITPRTLELIDQWRVLSMQRTEYVMQKIFLTIAAFPVGKIDNKVILSFARMIKLQESIIGAKPVAPPPPGQPGSPTYNIQNNYNFEPTMSHNSNLYARIMEEAHDDLKIKSSEYAMLNDGSELIEGFSILKDEALDRLENEVGQIAGTLDDKRIDKIRQRLPQVWENAELEISDTNWIDDGADDSWDE